jgi:alpha-beta hydrolase superfamily lysophospholipase/tetratricopeptide (TPR) repeat protein
MTIRPWQARSALAASLVATLLAPVSSTAALAQAPEESLVSAAPTSLQTEADALYAKRQFKEALPKYEKLVLDTDTCESRMTSAKNFSQEQLKALTDLADSLCQAKQYSRARAIYEQIQSYWNKQPSCAIGAKNQLESELAVAGCYFHEHNYKEAERLLPHCAELAKSKELDKSYQRRISTLVQIYRGEVLYRQRNYGSAAKVFEAALEQLTEDNTIYLSYDLNKMVLENLGGCYQYLGAFNKAEPILRAMALLDKNYFGDTDIRYGWSLFSLSEALKACHRNEEALPIYQKAIYVFRHNNRERIATEYGIDDEQLKQAALTESAEELEKKKKLAHALTIAIYGSEASANNSDGDKNLQQQTGHSSFFDHCERHPASEKLGAWNLKPSGYRDAPGWVWVDPRVPRKAILVCIHGLGLHHKACESFAQRICKEGITVVSFDVRGFGSFLESKGNETLNMDGCVSDIVNVLGELRQDYKGLRIFLLGESMGGALALRVAAKKPELIDGVVCSVPAGQRYRETGTKLKVAFNLVSNKNKELNIGKGVVNRSTSDQQERMRWSDDPNSRLNLSAKELLNFEQFMRQNAEYARQITKSPVIVFQGNQDRLVKREGTYDLFEAVGTQDKTLVLLGDREHLIFEANPFKDDITLGIVGWLNAHSKN